MKRSAKKLVLPSIIASLKSQGFKPLYRDGELVDFRRVRNRKLEIRRLEVHPSGRVTVHHSKE